MAEREELIDDLIQNLNPDGEGWVHTPGNVVWNVIADAYDSRDDEIRTLREQLAAANEENERMRQQLREDPMIRIRDNCIHQPERDGCGHVCRVCGLEL